MCYKYANNLPDLKRNSFSREKFEKNYYLAITNDDLI